MKGLDLKTAALIIASISAVASPFVTIAVAQEKINNLQESTKIQWNRLSENSMLTLKHETLIPILQSDIKEIKDVQKSNENILKSIAWKLNVPEGNSR